MKRAAPHRGVEVHYGETAEDDDRPSKSQLKRDSTALQVLGKALTEMPPERLAKLDMPEALLDALLQWQNTRSHEGRRRQMQYVGKLMRQADEEPLREAVAAFKLGSAQDALALHQAEAWRAELIAGDEALTRFLQQHPDTDVQRLRSLVRAARRDGAGLNTELRQPKSVRDLFQFIRPLVTAHGSAKSTAEEHHLETPSQP